LVDREELRGAMALFASTSPSYLILQSLDLCNAYLSDGYSQKLNDCIARISRLKSRLSEDGIYPAPTDEPLKLVFTREATGYSGTELADQLRVHGVEPEMADGEILVLMVTPENTDSDIERVYAALSDLPIRSTEGYVAPPCPAPARRVCSPRRAMLSRCESVSVERAIGRICAAPTVSCPPAIPIVVSGELIDRAATELLRFYGINTVEVVIEE
jgi:arginine/lysine/ornithine decarboxylase